jgi:HEAT repeat protein
MRDPRGLALLRLALATDEAASPAMFVLHGVRLPWPQFLHVIYGTYGRAACDDLESAAASAPDARVAVSAAQALASLRCHGAAPLLRGWAASGDAPRASAALSALGTLGQPADRDLLLACARHADVAVRRGCAYGIVEYGDPSLVPALLELARAEDAFVRREAVLGLLHAPTPEGGRAVLAAREKLGDERAAIEDQLRSLARWNELDADAILAGDEAAWRALSKAELERKQTVLARRPGDPELTREELAVALARWEKDGRVTQVAKRSLLAVATADDLPALYRVRARVLERQSDEALDELALLEHVIRIVDRRRMGVRYPNL